MDPIAGNVFYRSIFLYDRRCRPDIGKNVPVSAVLLPGLNSGYFLTITALVPGQVRRAWNLAARSGIPIAGVPAGELLFAFASGLSWSAIKEYFTREKVPKQYIPGF